MGIIIGMAGAAVAYQHFRELRGPGSPANTGWLALVVLAAAAVTYGIVELDAYGPS